MRGRKTLDAQALLATVDGDKEFLRRLVDLFFESCPGYLSEMRDSTARGHREGFCKAAHALKGGLGALHADASFDAALQMERIGREGNLAEAGQLQTVLEQELELLRPALTDLAERGAG